jgi:hypothetical protein
LGQSGGKKPEIRFHYQGSGLQSGYMLKESLSHFNFSQYHRDYSVRDAESEIIGVRRSEFMERFEDFNMQSTRFKNENVKNSYVQGEYEQ